TYFGHHHGYYYGHHYPHHWWYGGYQRPWWRHSHWPGHYYPSGSSFWIYSSPIVLGSRSRAKASPENPTPKPQLSQRMRQEQGELLRILKIGDKQDRIAAGRELTAFYFDDKARAALEDALLKDPEPQVRKEIAASLGNTADARVTAALRLAKAKDPDRGVRQAAYRSLIMIEGY
ncbi:MAG: HEAT repeat domain-containing protein, partial [Planctomycetota bacterium]